MDLAEDPIESTPPDRQMLGTFAGLTQDLAAIMGEAEENRGINDDVAAADDLTQAAEIHGALGEEGAADVAFHEDSADAEKALDEDGELEHEDEAGDEEEKALPPEAWMSYPSPYRELWERLRPKALRREAGKLHSLKFPAAAVSRLMRLHPDLQMRSAESAEIINIATVLLLQAVVAAAGRGRGSEGRLTFEHIREVCLTMREMQFLHPLACTLDGSALVARPDMHAHVDARVAEPSKPPSKAAPPPPGQAQLSSNNFARLAAMNSAAEAEQRDAESAGELTPDLRARNEVASLKRKAQESGAKAPKGRSKALKTSQGPGLSAFFQRLSTPSLPQAASSVDLEQDGEM